MKKQLFAIMSPTMGKREDIPSILLEKVFTTDNENSHIRYGEIHRVKMRLKELLTNPADTTVDSESAAGGNKVLSVVATSDFVVGETVIVDIGEDDEVDYVIAEISADTSLTMVADLERIHESGEVVDQAGLNKVRTPDENPVLAYHRFVKRSTGKEYLLLFTKAHIYHWNDATKVLDEKFICSGDCENWEVVTYNDQVVATNDVDKVLISDMSGDFEPLDTASGIEYETGVYLTRAKHLIVFENHLILGYITEDAEVYPQRVRWNARGEEAEWITGTSGSVEVGKSDFLMGFGKYRGYLIIFKEDTYYKMWLVPSSLIFNLDLMSTKIGCKSSHSIINDKYGRLFFLASDYTIKEISLGEVSTLIDKTIKTISPAYAYLIRSTFINEYGEILWAMPCNSATNNVVISLKDGKWNQYDLAISAFGDFERQTGYSWDTLATSTWESWGWDKWDIQDAEKGFKINLAADFSGYTHALNADEKDNGEDYSGFFVLSTDLYDKQGLSFYKRLLDLLIYVRKETTGTLTIEIKRDYESSWQSAGTIDLTGDKEILVLHLPVDFRAKHFLIKIGDENRYRFIGIIFKYLIAGER